MVTQFSTSLKIYIQKLHILSLLSMIKINMFIKTLKHIYIPIIAIIRYNSHFLSLLFLIFHKSSQKLMKILTVFLNTIPDHVKYRMWMKCAILILLAKATINEIGKLTRKKFFLK